MNQIVNQEWTSSEREEAKLVIAKFERNSDDINDDDNEKHDIYCELHSWFPWKTMQEVKDLYADLVLEMLMVEERYDGSLGEHGIVNTMDGLVNVNFGLQEKASMDIMEFLFGNPVDAMILMDTEEVLVVEQNKVGVLENKMPIHQPMDTPYTRRFWTAEEHRLFLCGLCAFGRGKWKSISKYFVTTRTPVQIASHAQKYFKKLERKELRNQRYSINNVEIDDVDQWKMNNSSSAQQAPAFAKADNHNPSLGLQTPPSTFFPVNNIAQNHMMFPVADLMEGAENFFPTNEQGSA
ncbi:unnamed protein product [Alopecurus aequalis]